MATHHGLLTEGRWQTLSLAEQLGNIGSEVYRAGRAKGEHTERFQNAVSRGLELIDLTINDERWAHRLEELTRLREVFCDAAGDGKEYKSSFHNLQPYFDQFAFLARRK